MAAHGHRGRLVAVAGGECEERKEGEQHERAKAASVPVPDGCVSGQEVGACNVDAEVISASATKTPLHGPTAGERREEVEK
jgi:hypothetical protein